MTPAEKLSKESILAQIFANDDIRREAHALASMSRTEDDPRVTDIDVSAARRYLAAAIMRMSDVEARSLNPKDMAGLWARGALGCARYRAKRGKSA